MQRVKTPILERTDFALPLDISQQHKFPYCSYSPFMFNDHGAFPG